MPGANLIQRLYGTIIVLGEFVKELNHPGHRPREENGFGIARNGLKSVLFGLTRHSKSLGTLLDDLLEEGILITRSRPVAKITPIPCSCGDIIETIEGLASNPQDDLFSTGVV